MWPFNKTKVIPGDYQAMRAEEVFAAQRQIRQLGLDAARYRWLRDGNVCAAYHSGKDLDNFVDAGITREVLRVPPPPDANNGPTDRRAP